MSVAALDDRRREPDRIPPQSLEAEMALLGALLVDRETLAATVPMLEPSDFYAHVHETLFAVIRDLEKQSAPVDLISVTEELQRRKRLDEVGGTAYLTKLIDTVQTVTSATYYAKLIREKSTLRKLIATGHDITRLGYEGEVDISEALAIAEQRLRSVTERSLHGDVGQNLRSAMLEAFAAINGGENWQGGLQTPWPKVNKHMGGFYPGDLCVVSAGPGVGKTGAIIDLADYIADKYGLVHLYTLEMSKREIVQRLWALYARVAAKRIRAGNLDDWQIEAIGQSYDLLKLRPLEIFEQSRLAAKPWTVDNIRAQLARAKDPVRAVFVDYINCLDDPESRGAENLHERLDAIYKKLLRVAAEFQTVLFVVHPVNRDGMKGEPLLKDLKGGGNAEYHAHAIIFLHREKVLGSPDEQRVGKFILAKNRDGVPGYVDAHYEGYRHLWLESDQQNAWFEAVEQTEFAI